MLKPHIQNRLNLRVLDLGCGTGLMGTLIANHCTELIGIDVSTKMLQVAKNKDLYQRLECTEAERALSEFQNLDIVIASDVFTYIGDLTAIFKKTHRALKLGGYFAFTVEKSDQVGFHLTKNIRYEHHKGYIDQLIKANLFTLLEFNETELRQQFKQPVMGYVVLLSKA